jgi:hypothetical protein
VNHAAASHASPIRDDGITPPDSPFATRTRSVTATLVSGHLHFRRGMKIVSLARVKDPQASHPANGCAG